MNAPEERSIIAVILAAGKGTRMQSEIPKVLMPACGRPLIDYVLDAVEAAGIEKKIVVVGYRADDVRDALKERSGVSFVEQKEQLGTGHAVMVCEEELQGHSGGVLVVTGDSPLIQVASIQALTDKYRAEVPGCLLGTLLKDDPQGLGRIVRDANGNFLGIVEEKDADDEQRKIREVNMSTYVFDCQPMLKSFQQLSNTNKQREYYITDCPAILKSMGHLVDALPVLQPCEAMSVNNLEELAQAEAEIKKQFGR